MAKSEYPALAKTAVLTERASAGTYRTDAHSDAITVWMVALSTAALFGLLPAIKELAPVQSMSPGEVGRLLAPFVIATILGAAHRSAMQWVMHYSAQRWLIVESALTLGALHQANEVRDLLPHLGELFGIPMSVEKRKGLYPRERRWRQLAGAVSALMYLAFLAGIVQVAYFLSTLGT